MKWKNLFSRKVAVLALMLMVPLHIFATGMQTMSIDSGKISITARSITVKQVLTMIEQKSAYRFLFNDDLPELNKKIDVDVQNQDVEQFMKSVLEQNSAKAQIMDNHLVVVTRDQVKESQSQQQKEIKGVVKDAKTGELLIGANVVVKGTTTGTITDFDGAYRLQVPVNSTIVVSYIGYKGQEIVVANQAEINVNLEADGENLDEVVVVGYGVMRKSDLTAAVASVKGDVLSVRATTNPAEALQGRVAGVNIQKTSGVAGAGVRVKIRGVNSTGSNDPLYIIDGFPNSISNVNPDDIESIEILKDGAAAAIYGSVAANGVVIVTTKKGKEGDVIVDVNSYVSFVDVAKKLDLLNGEEYQRVNRMMYENAGEALPPFVTKPGANTNWQDEVMRNGLAHNHSIGMRGGKDNLTFALSANLADDKGIIIDNNFKQQNARLNVNFKKSIFDIDAQMAFASIKNEQPNFSLKEVYMISPLLPVYDSSEEFGYALTNKDGLPNNVNPVAHEHFVTSWSKKQDITTNFSIAANFTNWLQFKSSYSYRGINDQGYYHHPKFVADPKSIKKYPFYQESRGYEENQIIDNVLSFNKKIGLHSVNAMLGSSTQLQKFSYNTVGVEGKKVVYSVEDGKLKDEFLPGGFLDEYFMTMNGGIGGTLSATGSKPEYNRVSFFGRLNYSYNDRYLLQFTMRRDGSSKFGKDNRWGNFPSVALGWRISEEEFFPKNDVISNFKLRGSWGRLGSENALNYYDHQSLIYSGNNLAYGYVQGNGQNAWQGSISPAFENRTLKWETKESINIGFDYGLWNNTLTGSLNYYVAKTKDLIITKRLPVSAGLWDPKLNVGEFENRGFELELNYSNHKGELNYNVGLNLSTLKNEVTKLADQGQIIYGTGLRYGSDHVVNQTTVGQPVGSFFLYQADGIFQSMDEVNAHRNKDGALLQPKAKPGDIRFKDMNGDGKFSPADKVYSGNGLPKAEVNLSGSASYRGFDFSLLIGSAWGHDLYNGNRFQYESMSSSSNFLKSTLNAWTPDNTNTTVPRAVKEDPNWNSRESTRFLEYGDFIRLRNIQLGYSLPKGLVGKVGIERARFYLSGDNLLTWTKYDGIDPEFASDPISSNGVDNIIFPFTRSYVIGVQLSF